MKIVLLTSESLRHKYIAAQLAEELQLALVITEKKSAAIQDTTKLKKEDASFVSTHFKARNRSESYFFKDFQDFPKEVPQLKMPHESINSQIVKSVVDSLEPDYLVLFGTSIIKDPILKKYSGRIINLHLGLSPYYKGSATNIFPYNYNEPECVGATIHLATSNVDDGPVLHQLKPEIELGDDLHNIGNKTILQTGKILPKVIKALSEKKIVAQKQTSVGRICRNKDVTPDLLRKIYSKFEDGMIREYLKEKESRDKQKPIIELSFQL
ncbi:hypothetical protein LZ575_08630 [Antarcticibacterium sp. 1MA-6-2]|uniref:formyltransferase family protein n=1 Tax=Antarcticibacterium sp. 1MA-6-2 TaxID=2908210 RepID=UPI001F2A830E|nr:formyltransferase family protein [Antarcticibacterium sp. 1MA-6-2]UJH92538.1 hypothetical protein LZ575_08630 [Antarcticibacterium sp. 1MA-6-2]